MIRWRRYLWRPSGPCLLRRLTVRLSWRCAIKNSSIGPDDIDQGGPGHAHAADQSAPNSKPEATFLQHHVQPLRLIGWLGYLGLAEGALNRQVKILLISRRQSQQTQR